MEQRSLIGERQITVEEFLKTAPPELPLKVVCGASGVNSCSLDSHRIQKFGLALSGFPDYIHKGRIQNIGQSEIDFLEKLGSEGRKNAFAGLDPDRISCILLTKELQPPVELTEFAERYAIPVIQTPLLSSRAITEITQHLQRLLAPETTIHGVLLEMHGIGVLITGPSGIGKSECALDLITRGHRLVADDAVLVRRIGDSIEGTAPELTKEFLELHGLGIINLRDLFGVSAVCDSIRLELCIELQRWSEIAEIERIGLETLDQDIFGVRITKYILPVSSGRNLATLIDTAVRVYMLRDAGIDAAKDLIDRHTEILRNNAAGNS